MMPPGMEFGAFFGFCSQWSMLVNKLAYEIDMIQDMLCVFLTQ